MLNSILMMGSTLNKNKKINLLCLFIWIGYMLAGSNLESGLVFVVLNLIAFGVVLLFSRIFKGKISNAIVSVLSILIWSVAIDLLTYVFYPQFIMGQSLITYVMNGVIFNLGFCAINCVILVAGYAIEKLFNKILSVDSEKSVVNG